MLIFRKFVERVYIFIYIKQQKCVSSLSISSSFDL